MLASDDQTSILSWERRDLIDFIYFQTFLFLFFHLSNKVETITFGTLLDDSDALVTHMTVTKFIGSISENGLERNREVEREGRRGRKRE